MNPFLNVAQETALEAGSLIEKAIKRPYEQSVYSKGYGEIFTNIDIACERVIVGALQKAYPKHGIISEEVGHISGDSEYCWIIDPLDGTNNFIRGHPHIAVSIALRHNDSLEAAVVFDPCRNELFLASRGKGATMNQRRIRVSQCNRLENALVGTGSSLRENFHPELEIIFRKCTSVRRSGSIALDLAYVACGRLDAFWQQNVNQWDYAAGCLLVQEAGGDVQAYHDREKFQERGNIFAANARLLKAVKDTTN